MHAVHDFPGKADLSKYFYWKMSEEPQFSRIVISHDKYCIKSHRHQENKNIFITNNSSIVRNLGYPDDKNSRVLFEGGEVR